jgi:hypothetical protein
MQTQVFTDMPRTLPGSHALLFKYMQLQIKTAVHSMPVGGLL